MNGFAAQPPGGPAFATTHWSVVMQAAEANTDQAASALEALCQAYWYPLYAFARRVGHSPHDAQDLTQSFFAYLLEKRLLTKADPGAGRFRSFLLGSFRNFTSNEFQRANAAKRGGKSVVIPWESLQPEQQFVQEPASDETPETLFERAWAVTVLENALDALRAEHVAVGKRELFEQLQVFLTGDRGPAYSEVAAQLAVTESAVKVAVHRLRQRYRELLRSTVANTVADPLEIDGELRHLMQALNR